MSQFRAILGVLLVLSVSPALVAGEVEILLDSGEAEAVLEIADTIAETGSASESLWDRLWSSTGYVDLLEREQAMGVGFTQDEFRTFVESDAVIDNREELRRTLDRWKSEDMKAAAQRALQYLPAGATIRATIYPLIKPKSNSFVFTTSRGKAIFLYLDPETSAAKFENVVTHELHHIGYDSTCVNDEDSEDPRSVARIYLGAFGEGLAMLAAAGGADTDPHATSSVEERATWERNLARAASDIVRLEAFFSEVLSGDLQRGTEPFRARFFALINTPDAPQGPFYTVGWMMASTIERERGRKALLDVMCDPVQLLELYDVIAADRDLPRWSASFLRALRQ